MKYQPHFDWLDTIDSLYSKERYIIEKLDKDLDKMTSNLLDLNRSGTSEREIMEAVILSLLYTVLQSIINNIQIKPFRKSDLYIYEHDRICLF